MNQDQRTRMTDELTRASEELRGVIEYMQARVGSVPRLIEIKRRVDGVRDQLFEESLQENSR